jgi:hypothetical protein
MRVLVLNLLGGDPVHPIKSPSKSLDQFDGNLGIFSNDVGDAFFDMPNLSLSFGYDVGVPFKPEDFAEFSKDRAFHVDFAKDFAVSDDFQDTAFQNAEALAKLAGG